GRHRRPHLPRAAGAAARGAGPDQPPDRRAALHLGQDGLGARLGHPGQAGGAGAGGGRVPLQPAPGSGWVMTDHGARDPGPFFHGTKAEFAPGDLITRGYTSNYGSRRQSRWVYFSATLDAATWGAELAVGDGPGHIYRVQPEGPYEDD